jgi:pimeloyl-ACP methyl ester carboxylesterase
MRAAFAQFLAFPTDVEDNQASMVTKLTMPVLAIGGEQSFGANQAVVIPNAGHWLMEEQPAVTAIRTFLDAKNVKVEP